MTQGTHPLRSDRTGFASEQPAEGGDPRRVFVPDGAKAPPRQEPFAKDEAAPRRDLISRHPWITATVAALGAGSALLLGLVIPGSRSSDTTPVSPDRPTPTAPAAPRSSSGPTTSQASPTTTAPAPTRAVEPGPDFAAALAQKLSAAEVAAYNYMHRLQGEGDTTALAAALTAATTDANRFAATAGYDLDLQTAPIPGVEDSVWPQSVIDATSEALQSYGT